MIPVPEYIHDWNIDSDSRGAFVIQLRIDILSGVPKQNKGMVQLFMKISMRIPTFEQLNNRTCNLSFGLLQHFKEMKSSKSNCLYIGASRKPTIAA